MLINVPITQNVFNSIAEEVPLTESIYKLLMSYGMNAQDASGLSNLADELLLNYDEELDL